ncbi:MAG: TraR/DksA C4-type zinc finger protein [Desulforhopalus sp.]
MDLLDRATELEEEHRATALAFRFPVAVGPARELCLECEEPISEARRKAQHGCQLCRDCQEELEMEQRNGQIRTLF